MNSLKLATEEWEGLESPSSWRCPAEGRGLLEFEDGVSVCAHGCTESSTWCPALSASWAARKLWEEKYLKVSKLKKQTSALLESPSLCCVSLEVFMSHEVGLTSLQSSRVHNANKTRLGFGVAQVFLSPWMVSKCWESFHGNVTCISGDEFCICSLDPHPGVSICFTFNGWCQLLCHKPTFALAVCSPLEATPWAPAPRLQVQVQVKSTLHLCSSG